MREASRRRFRSLVFVNRVHAMGPERVEVGSSMHEISQHCSFQRCFIDTAFWATSATLHNYHRTPDERPPQVKKRRVVLTRSLP